MRMSEILYMVLALIGGLAIGTLFFGGLWFTVKKAVTSKIPALWFFASLVFRVCITLIGFYYISFGSWQRLLACVLGFILARFIVIQFTKSIDEEQLRLKKESNHAS